MLDAIFIFLAYVDDAKSSATDPVRMWLARWFVEICIPACRSLFGTTVVRQTLKMAPYHIDMGFSNVVSREDTGTRNIVMQWEPAGYIGCLRALFANHVQLERAEGRAFLSLHCCFVRISRGSCGR